MLILKIVKGREQNNVYKMLLFLIIKGHFKSVNISHMICVMKLNK